MASKCELHDRLAEALAKQRAAAATWAAYCDVHKRLVTAWWAWADKQEMAAWAEPDYSGFRVTALTD